MDDGGARGRTGKSEARNAAPSKQKDSDMPPVVPRATYRLQFHKDFGFDHATELAPYLARLGVSHLYASSYLKARPGSTHGYDIVDHDALNPELGDEASFDRMNAALAQNGLKQVLDFVPNHMGVGGADNPLWLDVLEWGPNSAHAGWFDIDWDPDRRYLRDKLLVPFLGDQYGAALEAGQLSLEFDEREGSFAIWAYDTHKLPICPLHYAHILGDAHPELERLGDAFSGLPEWRPQVGRRAGELKAELATLCRERVDVRHAVAAAVGRLNGVPGRLDSWRDLDALIQEQYWRAAHFRVAADDINYRRFFNINDLAGIRMELPEVFDHAHRLVFRLLKSGVLDGLRIDHIDGLLDPKGYLERLREKAGNDFYLVVEKILASHESLREDWSVQGTTGYDFTNLVLELLVNSAGEESFSRIYTDLVGRREPFADTVRDCKLRIMRNEMASELNVLARDAARVARQNPRTADFTRNILHRAIREVVACFPVYRTYVDAADAPTADDKRDLDWAIARARRNETAGRSIMRCVGVCWTRSSRRSPATGRAPWRAICDPGRTRASSSPPWRPSSAFAATPPSCSPRAITRGCPRRATGRTRSAPSRAGRGMRPCWWRWRASRGGGTSAARRPMRLCRCPSRCGVGSGASS